MRRMLAASTRPGEPGPGAFEHAVIPSAAKATLTQHPRNVFLFKAFLSDSGVSHAHAIRRKKAYSRTVRIGTESSGPSFVSIHCSPNRHTTAYEVRANLHRLTTLRSIRHRRLRQGR